MRTALLKVLPVFIMLALLLSCDAMEELLGDEESGQDKEAVSVNLTLLVFGPGSSVPEGRIEVPQGSPVEIRALPSAGSAFQHWEVLEGSEVRFDSPYEAETRVFLRDGSAVIRAVLAWEEEVYRLSLSDSEGGEVIASAGLESLELDSPVVLSALEDEGYRFDRWLITAGTGVEISEPFKAETTVTLTEGDGEIQALFVSQEISVEGVLAIVAAKGGSVDPVETLYLHIGETVPISATAEEGYRFTGWTIESGTAEIGTPNSLSTNVTLTDGSARIMANFESLTVYTLTVSAGSGGSVSPSGESSLQQGASLAIGATPSVGYRFDRWEIVSGTGVSLESPSSSDTRVTLSESDGEIRAVFSFAPSAVSGSVTAVSWKSILDANSNGVPEAGLLEVTLSGSIGETFSIGVFAQRARDTGLPVFLSAGDDFTMGRGGSKTVDYPILGNALPSAGTYDLEIRLYHGTTILDSFRGSPISGVAFEP